MSEFRLIALVVTAVINLLLAGLVYKNNPKSATNKTFGALAIVTTLWLTDVYLSVNPHFFSQALLWVRLSIFFAAPQISLFFLLAHTLPADKIQLSPLKTRVLLIATLLLMVDSLSPAAFTRAVVVNKSVEASAGPGIAPFGLFALTMSVSAIVVLYHKRKKSSGAAREQYRYMYIGIITMLSLLFLTVLLPVVLFKNDTFVPFVPLYTIIFLGATTYSIVRHKLFDIRAAVARSIGYLMVVFTLTLLYGIGLFGVIDVIFQSPNQEYVRQILSVILITPLAFIFQRTKEFFDHITTRLFYRDSYDIQDVLDSLGSIAVSEIELNRMLASTRQIFTTNIKSSFVEFVLFRDNKPYYEAKMHESISHELHALGKKIQAQRADLVVTNELDAEEGMRSLFQDADVALSLRLITHEQVVGYMLFGPKRSGDTYTQQDKKLFSIAANELAIAIQNALRFEEIKNFNVTLQLKVTEATRQLRHTNEKLRTLDESKDDFISMASHQLRTPLTSVKGYISLVLEGDAGKLTPLQKQMLEQAYTSSQRMVYLIADLLNVSRLKTGKFIIETKPVNLAKVVNEEMAQLKETAKARQLTMDYVQPEDFPEVMLDETKIRQVVMNFADNAIYYTPAGGHIKVELVDKPTTIELRIVDNGLGVPRAEQPHLFTKFYRAANARKARPDGTGLGLFMAKKVIIAQGGALIFTSVEGKGSTFGFVFSKSKLSVPETEEPPHDAIDDK